MRGGEGGCRSRYTGIDETIAFKSCIREARAMTFQAFNSPVVVGLDEPHLTARTPPAIHITRQSIPHVLAITDLPKVGEQGIINAARFQIDQVVRMAKEANQPVSFENEFGLFLPQVNGIFAENIEKRIVLNGGERALQNIPHKVRHDSAKTTARRIKMS